MKKKCLKYNIFFENYRYIKDNISYRNVLNINNWYEFNILILVNIR